MCYTNVLYRRTGKALISLIYKIVGESRYSLGISFRNGLISRLFWLKY